MQLQREDPEEADLNSPASQGCSGCGLLPAVSRTEESCGDGSGLPSCIGQASMGWVAGADVGAVPAVIWLLS